MGRAGAGSMCSARDVRTAPAATNTRSGGSRRPSAELAPRACTAGVIGSHAGCGGYPPQLTSEARGARRRWGRPGRNVRGAGFLAPCTAAAAGSGEKRAWRRVSGPVHGRGRRLRGETCVTQGFSAGRPGSAPRRPGERPGRPAAARRASGPESERPGERPVRGERACGGCSAVGAHADGGAGGGQGRGRTADLAIFSRALFQLSYLTRCGTGRPRSAGRGAELTGFEPATFTLTG